jgi:hypothetical protein
MKIKGIPVGTTMPRPDWNQDDPKRSDYIRNKPDLRPDWNQTDPNKSDYIRNKPDVVLCEKQTLDDEKKAQVRENIGAIGKPTKEGGVILTDIECNHRANYGAVASGVEIDRAGAPDNPAETDWRYNEAIGLGSMASGMGAVAYSRASKSLGYRTQTGYPPNAEEAAKRTEAIVKTVSYLKEVYDQSSGVACDFSNKTASFFTETGKEEYITFSVFDEKEMGITAGTGYLDLVYSCLETHYVEIVALDENREQISLLGRHEKDAGEGGCSWCDDMKRFQFSTPYGTKYIKLVVRLDDGMTMGKGAVTFEGIEVIVFPAGNVGQAAVAIGADTAALENHSFAGGYRSIAHKHCSFVFGRNSESRQVNAIAMGEGLLATGENQAVFGQYNNLNASLRFIVGVGTGDENRKNALEIAKETGNARFYGTLRSDGAFYCASTITTPNFYLGTDGRIQAGSGAANVKNSAAFGKGTTAYVEGMLVCGRYNDASLNPSQGILFAVGGGTADAPCNLFQVRTHGKQTKVNGSFSVNDKFVVNADSSVTVRGKLVLDSACYGDTLPTTGTAGQIFFLKKA